ncbi:MAG: TIGR02757 family protein [Spirochaetaceae bacterium]|jgi:uncharacterized protein (TIGR02757 family)|nr:TIGR02757 family protein [Spirochaetaceae bacterium]
MTENQCSSLKKKLDLWYNKTSAASFIKQDPLQFPHRYAGREDREITAFLAATIAWGRRDLILRSAERMFSLMGKSPYDYVMSSGCRKIGTKAIHRTFFEADLRYFRKGFRFCYTKYRSLEALFAAPLAGTKNDAADKKKAPDLWDSMALFRNEMAKANGGLYTKHIANPASSACKRINLALRWLVRPGPLDLGLWKSISPSFLFIPLDLHVGRVARSLGLLKRKSNDKKAVIELTERLKSLCPDDPAKYDLALFGMGVGA